MNRSITAGIVFTVIAALSVCFTSCGKKDEVTINNMRWMARNLDVTAFRNGDPIPEIKDDQEWIKAGKEKKPAWCYFRNNEDFNTRYGKLYNWWAVADPRGLAPKGWHVATKEDWIKLRDFLGGMEAAGEKLKSKSDWPDARDEVGFNAMATGSRNAGDGIFHQEREATYWWTSTKKDESSGPVFVTLYKTMGDLLIEEAMFYDQYGYCVRCVKD